MTDEDSGLGFADHVAPTEDKENFDAKTSANKSTFVDNADIDDFIGDFSRPCCLPVVRGKHFDLQCISPETVN